MSDTKTILEVDYPKKYAKDIIEVLLVKGEKANFRVIDGAEAVAKITQNESLQIALYAPDGKPFDMSKYVGCSLFTAPQPAAIPEGWLLIPKVPTAHLISKIPNAANESEAIRVYQQIVETASVLNASIIVHGWSCSGEARGNMRCEEWCRTPTLCPANYEVTHRDTQPPADTKGGEQYEAGDTEQNGPYKTFTSGINLISQWGNIVECHGNTAEEAEALRDTILYALNSFQSQSNQPAECIFAAGCINQPLGGIDVVHLRRLIGGGFRFFDTRDQDITSSILTALRGLQS